MKGFGEYAYIAHITTLIVVFVFFAFLFVLIFKHPRKINRCWDYVIGLFILAVYAFVFFETITNSSINYHFAQSLLPWHNFTGLIVVVGSIAIMLPRKLKIRNLLLGLSTLMSVGLIYGVFDSIIDYYKTFSNSYYEREFWLTFYPLVLIIYCISSLNTDELKITWKEIIFAISSMLILYGVSLAINLNSELSFFGVGKYFYNLIQYPAPIYALLDFASIIAFVLLSYLIFVLPIKKRKNRNI
ncbi:MAG: hypothetical protein MJ245_07225 [Clostridia bacterium]|nr:hypothetical protein [Clostridia bacterium]